MGSFCSFKFSSLNVVIVFFTIDLIRLHAQWNTRKFVILFFIRKGNGLQVLETSQGGSHPQKEPVLALLHNLVFVESETL